VSALLLMLTIGRWAGLSVTALAFGWTVGGHFDFFSAAGVVALVVWMLCERALKNSGRWGAGPAGESGIAGRGTVGTDAPTEPDLSRLDRLDGVGSGR
jgi:hypothetical protein